MSSLGWFLTSMFMLVMLGFAYQWLLLATVVYLAWSVARDLEEEPSIVDEELTTLDSDASDDK